MGNAEVNETFNTLKDKLSEKIVLKFPDFSKPFILTTDVSDTAKGGVLQQTDSNGQMRPLTYFIRSLQKAELNYSVIENEALVIIHGLR